MSASPETTVTANRACAKCGYSLRLLPRSGTCPECGYSIIRSLHLPATRTLLEQEDRILARRDAAARWRKRATTFAIVSLLTAALAIVLIALPVLPAFAQSERASFVTAITVGLMLVGGLMLGLLFVLVRAWLGAWLQHAAYIATCRTSGNGARTERERTRDDRIVRRAADYALYVGFLKFVRILMIALTGFIVVLVLWNPRIGAQATETFPAMLFSWLFWILLTSVLLWIARARNLHAQSIQYYRAADVAEQHATCGEAEAV